MIYRFLFVLLILFAAGCVVPVVVVTPPAAPSLSPSPTAAPSETATSTFTPSATATATPTPTITNTPAPTETADQINMSFSAAITVTFNPTNPAQHCLLTFYDVTLQPGFMGVWRRDKGGYFNCVKGE